jgi:transcriptional regulator with XRE-family HTH domain
MSRLRRFMTDREWTQAQLAEFLGLDQGLVSTYLSGAKRPSLRTAIQIEKRTRGAVPAASWVS